MIVPIVMVAPIVLADGYWTSDNDEISADNDYFTHSVFVSSSSSGKWIRGTASETCGDVEVQSGYVSYGFVDSGETESETYDVSNFAWTEGGFCDIEIDLERRAHWWNSWEDWDTDLTDIEWVQSVDGQIIDPMQSSTMLPQGQWTDLDVEFEVDSVDIETDWRIYAECLSGDCDHISTDWAWTLNSYGSVNNAEDGDSPTKIFEVRPDVSWEDTYSALFCFTLRVDDEGQDVWISVDTHTITIISPPALNGEIAVDDDTLYIPASAEYDLAMDVSNTGTLDADYRIYWNCTGSDCDIWNFDWPWTLSSYRSISLDADDQDSVSLDVVPPDPSTADSAVSIELTLKIDDGDDWIEIDSVEVDLNVEASIQASFVVMDGVTIQAGDDHTFGFEVDNSGSSEISEAEIHYSSNCPGVLNPWGTYSSTHTIYDLAPGSSTTVNLGLEDIPSSTSTTSCSLSATIWFDDDVQEVCLQLDSITVPITITPDVAQFLISVEDSSGNSLEIDEIQVAESDEDDGYMLIHQSYDSDSTSVTSKVGDHLIAAAYDDDQLLDEINVNLTGGGISVVLVAPEMVNFTFDLNFDDGTPILNKSLTFELDSLNGQTGDWSTRRAGSADDGSWTVSVWPTSPGGTEYRLRAWTESGDLIASSEELEIVSDTTVSVDTELTYRLEVRDIEINPNVVVPGELIEIHWADADLIGLQSVTVTQTALQMDPHSPSEILGNHTESVTFPAADFEFVSGLSISAAAFEGIANTDFYVLSVEFLDITSRVLFYSESLVMNRSTWVDEHELLVWDVAEDDGSWKLVSEWGTDSSLRFCQTTMIQDGVISRVPVPLLFPSSGEEARMLDVSLLNMLFFYEYSHLAETTESILEGMMSVPDGSPASLFLASGEECIGIYSQLGSQLPSGLPNQVFLQHPDGVQNLLDAQIDQYIYPIFRTIDPLGSVLTGDAASYFDISDAVLIIRDPWEPQNPIAISPGQNGGFVSFGVDSCLSTPTSYSNFLDVCPYHNRTLTADTIEALRAQLQMQLTADAESYRVVAGIMAVVELFELGFELAKLGTFAVWGVSRRMLIEEADRSVLLFRASSPNIGELDDAIEHLRAIRYLPVPSSTATKFGGISDWATMHLTELSSRARGQALLKWDSLPSAMQSSLDYDIFISDFVRAELISSCVIGQASHCIHGTLAASILSFPLDASFSVIDGNFGRLKGVVGESAAASIYTTGSPVIRAADGTLTSAHIFSEGDPHDLQSFWRTFAGEAGEGSGHLAAGFPDIQTFGAEADLLLVRLGVPAANLGNKVVLTQVKAGESLSSHAIDGLSEMWWRSHQLSSIQTGFPGGGLKQFHPVLFCNSPHLAEECLTAAVTTADSLGSNAVGDYLGSVITRKPGEPFYSTNLFRSPEGVLMDKVMLDVYSVTSGDLSTGWFAPRGVSTPVTVQVTLHDESTYSISPGVSYVGERVFVVDAVGDHFSRFSITVYGTSVESLMIGGEALILRPWYYDILQVREAESPNSESTSVNSSIPDVPGDVPDEAPSPQTNTSTNESRESGGEETVLDSGDVAKSDRIISQDILMLKLDRFDRELTSVSSTSSEPPVANSGTDINNTGVTDTTPSDASSDYVSENDIVNTLQRLSLNLLILLVLLVAAFWIEDELL